MENNNVENIIKSITKVILTNPLKMIREEDIRNLCKDYDFDTIISKIYINLKAIGFELISSRFIDQNFYIVTSEGKDDKITPSQYGVLVLILAYSKEVDENIKIDELKDLFSDLWDSDVKYLIENDYLREFTDLGIIKITPLGKAIFKNIIQNLTLKDILKLFEEN